MKTLLILILLSTVGYTATDDKNKQFYKDMAELLSPMNPEVMKANSARDEALVPKGEPYDKCKVVRFTIPRCKAKFNKHYKFIKQTLKCKTKLPWCTSWDMCKDYDAMQCNTILAYDAEDLPEDLTSVPEELLQALK